jgi:hypothetical protein
MKKIYLVIISCILFELGCTKKVSIPIYTDNLKFEIKDSTTNGVFSELVNYDYNFDSISQKYKVDSEDLKELFVYSFTVIITTGNVDVSDFDSIGVQLSTYYDGRLSQAALPTAVAAWKENISNVRGNTLVLDIPKNYNMMRIISKKGKCSFLFRGKTNKNLPPFKVTVIKKEIFTNVKK